MSFRILTYSLLSAFVISGCTSQKASDRGQVPVGDFDRDGLEDTVFAHNFMDETDVGIKYGNGKRQKITNFEGSRFVRFANIYGNKGDVLQFVWVDTSGALAYYNQITNFYNKGVSGDSVVFSTEGPCLATE